MLAALVLLSAPLFGLSATGYQQTRWGMTLAQVKALYPESMDAAQARKLKPGTFEKEGEFLLAKTTILHKPAWAVMRFGGKGLESVRIRPEPEQADFCPSLADALGEKYGSPKKNEKVDDADLYSLDGVWENGETRIELVCSSIKTEAALAKMKKSSPGLSLPDALPADAVELEYRRK